MSNCCHNCKFPNTGYQLHYNKCGVCALMGKSKCYFDESHEARETTPHRFMPKTFESTELSTKVPHESPQFSDSQKERQYGG